MVKSTTVHKYFYATKVVYLKETTKVCVLHSFDHPCNTFFLVTQLQGSHPLTTTVRLTGHFRSALAFLKQKASWYTDDYIPWFRYFHWFTFQQIYFDMICAASGYHSWIIRLTLCLQALWCHLNQQEVICCKIEDSKQKTLHLCGFICLIITARYRWNQYWILSVGAVKNYDRPQLMNRYEQFIWTLNPHFKISIGVTVKAYSAPKLLYKV